MGTLSGVLFAEERHLGEFLSGLRQQERGTSPESPPTTEGPFRVNVRCSHSDHTYHPDEPVQLFIQSEKDGYVYIRDGKNQQVYPNEYHSQNAITAGQEQRYPPENAPFTWKFDGAKPQEELTVYVSRTPLAAKDLITMPTEEIVKITMTFHIRDAATTPPTTPTPEPEPSSKSQRYLAMFIQTHVTHYQTGEWILDRNFRYRVGNSVQVRHAMLNVGECADLGLITGTDFTKPKIYRAFQNMLEKTKPGDEIFIYWESHGGPTNKFGDTTGEADGVNEVLFLSSVKYHPEAEKIADLTPEDILTDDEFAELVTSLKDRKVMIIMEACFSGGMVEGAANNQLFSRSRSPFPRNELEEIGQVIIHLSNQPLNLQPIWRESSTICNYDDVPMNQRFAANRSRSGFQSFANQFFRKIKDIQTDHNNLAMFMSCSEDESSWCAVINPQTGEVFLLKCGELDDNKELVLPIGAPVYALLLVMVDKEGKYTKTPGHPTFDDFIQVANRLIPANNARIVRLHPNHAGNTQVPRSINNIGEVLLIP